MHTEKEVLETVDRLLKNRRKGVGKMEDKTNVKKKDEQLLQLLEVTQEIIREKIQESEEKTRENEDLLDQLQDSQEEARVWKEFHKENNPKNLTLPQGIVDLLDWGSVIEGQELIGEKANAEMIRLENLSKELLFKQGKSVREVRAILDSSARRRLFLHNSVGVVHGELKFYH